MAEGTVQPEKGLPPPRPRADDGEHNSAMDGVGDWLSVRGRRWGLTATAKFDLFAHSANDVFPTIV
jgi:hypothetical protein